MFEVIMGLGSVAFCTFEVTIGLGLAAFWEAGGKTGSGCRANRSPSQLRRSKISCGKLHDERPILAYDPNIAAKGEHFIPLW